MIVSGGLGREDDGSEVDGGFMVFPCSEDVLTVSEGDDVGLSRVVLGLSWRDGRRRREGEMWERRSQRVKRQLIQR